LENSVKKPLFRLMIIEDEVYIRKGLCNGVPWRQLGFVVVGVAEDAEEALSLFDEARVDVVLTDIRLPGLDGLALIEKIKNKSKDVLFVIISGYGDFNYAQKAIELGVDHYLLKPTSDLKIEEIFNSVYQKLFKRHKDRQKLSQMEYDAKYGRCQRRKQILAKLLQGEEVTKDNIQKADLKPSAWYGIGVVSLEHLSGSFEEDNIKELWEQVFIDANIDIIVMPQKQNGVIVVECQVRPLNIQQHITDLVEKLSTNGQLYCNWGGFFLGLEGIKVSYQCALTSESIIKENLFNTDDLIIDIVSYIEKNYANHITLEQLANVFYMNATYICTYFRKKTGIKLFDLLAYVRIDRAKYKLKNTENSIADIAEQCGFTDYRRFGKVFKLHTGYSPSEYRKRVKGRKL
jgi:two-component system response regulator YesN